MTRFFSPITPLLKGWLFSFAAFGLLATIMVGQFAIAVSMPFPEALKMAARDWLGWAVLTPLIFRLVSRFPIERARWKLGVPVQFAAAIASIAAVQWNAEVLWPPPFARPNRGDRLPPPPPENRSAPPVGERGPGTPLGPPPPFRRDRVILRSPSNLFFIFSFRFPIYLGIVSIAHAFLFYRRSQARERSSLELEARLASARLDALRMQLQPHLLFNTLNTIAGLVHDQPDKADAMLTKLSELLRLTLETSQEQELPLQREIDFVERYLALLHARFEERLHFELQIAPDTRAALVPTMLIQPLVENAVEHGLQPKPEGGSVTVRSWRENGVLRIEVRDNGVGLSAAPEEGIGLGNTRARLRQLYGSHARIELRNHAGVTVDVSLPYRTSDSIAG